jgi:RNA polymerase sigma factor (sigma-70 family)
MTHQEFKAIYDEHAVFLLRAVQHAFRMDKDRAEDVLQEVFQSVWDRSLMNVKDIRSYLFTCCRRVVVRQRKRQEKIHSAIQLFLYREGKTDTTHPLLDKLEIAIHRLPAQQRQALEYKLQGAHWRDIATSMGISAHTVNNHLVVGWKNLKAAFNAN